ncbi:MAG: vWA domain-containing protein [Pirellulaceae bacterium]
MWLDQIETNVRRTQDLVLIGSQSTLQAADQEWNSLFGTSTGSGDFHDLHQFSELVSDAYYWRDRSWTVMPHLLFWVSSETVFHRDVGLVDRIVRLADSTFELSNLLDSVPDSIPTASIQAELESQRNDVAAVLRELERAFGNRVSELERSGSIRESLAEITVVLSTPLVTGQTRSGLMRKLVDHLSQSISETSPVDHKADGAYAEWLAGKPNSALLRILSVAAADQQNSTNRQMRSGQFAKIGGQIRNRIASLSQAVQPSILETEDRLANSNLSIAQSRSGLSQADQLIRPVVSISPRHPWSESASNPGYDLHRIDVLAWLLWHGERSLFDFYASTASFDTPFFVESVRQHLSASMIAWPGKSAHRELLRKRLEESEAGLLSWKPIETTDSEKLPGEPFLHHQIKFQGNALFPPGDVALFTRAAGTEIRVEEEASNQPATRMARNIHESTVTEQTLLDVVASSEFEAVALFRGHVRKVPFYGQEVKGPIVRLSNDPTLMARVRVKGDRKEITQLVFVLDCSGSMKNNGRMSKAKRVLESVLESLEVDVAPFRVSLVAYGHRSHWEKTGDKTYTPAASPYFREFGRGTLPLPGDDVQLVYESPARFGNDERRDLLKVIDQLDHFGETPLFFAVQQAVQALDDRDGPKHVIVITDGDPDVFGRATPPRENKLLSASSFTQQVLQPLANGNSSINLNFVFFQFGGGEIGQLVRGRPGINTFVANQEQELQSAILESLKISQFYVQDVEQSKPAKRIQLNQYWDEPNIQVQGRVFEVVLDGAAARNQLQ